MMNKYKYIFSLLLLLMIVGAGRAWAQGNASALIKNKAANQFAANDITGAGTEANPYVITTKEGLAYFSAVVYNAWTGRQGKYWRLDADIDMENRLWDLGSRAEGTTYAFQGTFDGNGHTISNLRIEIGAYQAYGFIPNLGYGTGANKGVLKNLTLDKVVMTQTQDANAGWYRVGIAVGYMNQHSLVDNVHVTNSRIELSRNISGSSGFVVSMLVGNVEASTDTYHAEISHCSVTSSSIIATTPIQYVNNKMVAVGGMIGSIPQNASRYSYVHHCVAEDVTIDLTKLDCSNKSSSGKYNLYGTRHSVGGVIGNLQEPRALPEHLYFSGKLNAPLAAVGPVVGTMTKSQSKADYIFMDYSGENVAFAMLSDLSVGSTWYYHDYRLGVSQALLNQTERTLNFDSAEVTDGYLTITDGTLKKTNMLRTSRTLLAYRVSSSNNLDFAIYPTYNTNSQSFPAYYMAYAQGVNRGRCIATAADAATIKQALLMEGKDDITLTDNDATLRGFDEHSLTIANTGGIAIDEYEWYKDGQKISATGTNAEIDRERDGRGVVVVAKKDGNIVASATARLNSASFRLKDPASPATAGTKENPYLLGGSYGDKELELLSYLSVLPEQHLWYGYNSTNHYDKAYYELDGDIDLGAIEGFTPIAWNVNGDLTYGGYGASYAFLGVFNGNGHTIRNANIKWSASDVYGNNYIRPWGIFGYVGGNTVSKVGEDVPSNTTIVNLIIDNATVSHDPTNSTFAFSGANANHCYVGTLAGLVAVYTTLANIEVRNSRITDVNDTQNYLLAGKRLSIGGVIGRMQGLTTDAGPLANSIRTSSIVADVDMDINHAAFTSATNDQVRGLTIGGIIGSIEGQVDEMQVNWPQQTFFSGKIESANAFVGPVFGSADIRATNNNEWGQYCGHYMGTSQTSSTGLKPTDPSLQMPFDKNYFGDYRIWYGGSYQPITDTYPTNTCGYGARTLKTHSHANSSMYNDGDLYEYQGVNYGEYKNIAAMTEVEKTALVESLAATEGEALKFHFKIGADGKLHLADNNELLISLSDNYDGNTVEKQHTLTLASSRELTANYVEWVVNSIVDAGQSGLGSSVSTYDVGNTEQLIVVNVYSDGTKTQLLATSNSVVIPAFTYNKSTCVVFINQKTGNNALDGLTIATAVKDFQIAYRRVRQLREKISSSNDWNTNFIVVCTTGSYDTNTTTFHIEDEDTKGGSSEPLTCTITGSWDDDGTGQGVTGGTIYIHSPIGGDGYATDACVGADTRLADIVIRGGQNSDNTRFSCNMHNVLFDTGITIQQFGGIASTQVEGANMPAITLLVTHSEYGINDDEIDLPDWVTSKEEPITIEIRSGRWARVMTGRLPSGTYASLKNRAILASPSKPLRARFIVDIQNDNPPYLDGNGKVIEAFSQDDIGLFCAGLTDGTVYADVTLDLLAGNVRLITGGNQGNSQTNASGRMPSASFFGRTTVNMSQPDDGRETRVREIYLCGLGRNASSQNICNMFFYGQSTLNMNGGTVTRNIYGATSGGISGITDGKGNYTYDATIPYTSGIGNAHNGVTYGSFLNNGIANVVTMTSGLETIRLDYVKPVINITGGTVGGNIYGGGWGEANGLPAKQAMAKAGTHYGDVDINISGGTIEGSIFGCGAGSSTYYETAETEDRDKEDFRAVASFYGNSYIRITGGKVNGNIFGGGAGLESKNEETEYEEIAKVFGTTNITIDNAGFTEAEPFVGNIYGGGHMGMVEGSTYIKILEGHIRGNIFGAGQGEEGHPNKAKVTGDTHVSVGQE